MLVPFNKEHFAYAHRLLPRLSEELFEKTANSKSGFIYLNSNLEPSGILICSLLWEKLPFIQHLIIEESKRNKGLGTLALKELENKLKEKGYKLVLLSTQADEKAQFLYRKLGYIDCGALFFEDTPFNQPAEIFLKKRLDR